MKVSSHRTLVLLVGQLRSSRWAWGLTGKRIEVELASEGQAVEVHGDDASVARWGRAAAGQGQCLHLQPPPRGERLLPPQAPRHGIRADADVEMIGIVSVFKKLVDTKKSALWFCWFFKNPDEFNKNRSKFIWLKIWTVKSPIDEYQLILSINRSNEQWIFTYILLISSFSEILKS
jgi:hypothetical protein